VTTIGQTYYSYDGEGRICAVQTYPFTGGVAAYGYLYDADGTRVAKGTITTSSNPLTQPLSCDPASNGFQITENYVLGPSGEELTMLDGNNNWLRTNLYAGGRLLATADMVGTSPALHFHLEDPLGTRRMQLSGEVASLGQPETDIQSLPFGDQLNSYADQYAPATADDSTPLYFTGKERDAESGNDYFGARYYGSSMGRFTAPDSGVDQDATDPQSWNLYSYVQNNPLTRTDADGRSIQICTTMNGTQHCTDGIDDDVYKAAQQGSNGSLNGPSLADLQNAGSGATGALTSTSTDANGNTTTTVVGTVKWTADNSGIQGPQAIQAFGQIARDGNGAIKSFGEQMALNVAGGFAGAGVGIAVDTLAGWSAEAAEILAKAASAVGKEYFGWKPSCSRTGCRTMGRTGCTCHNRIGYGRTRWFCKRRWYKNRPLHQCR
jgi:RHS repeat-associated protein